MGSVIQNHLNKYANFGPLSFKCMRDSQPQCCIQQRKSLKKTRNATNGDKHINEASKQTFASNLFKILCKYTLNMLSNWKICFNALTIQNYDQFLCILNQKNEIVQKMTYTNLPV